MVLYYIHMMKTNNKTPEELSKQFSVFCNRYNLLTEATKNDILGSIWDIKSIWDLEMIQAKYSISDYIYDAYKKSLGVQNAFDKYK